MQTEDNVKTNSKKSIKRRADLARPQTNASKTTRPVSQSASPLNPPSPQGQTKQDRVVAMLRQKGGTTVAAVMKTTGWQKHSVHGFLAGVVRKKLGLTLVSETANGERVYRIAGSNRTKVTSVKSKRAV